MTPNDRSARSVLLFWAPLAAQWLMMGLEGPFLAAATARQPPSCSGAGSFFSRLRFY